MGYRGNQGDRRDTYFKSTSAKPGYEYLVAYKITVPIYDYTVEFCSRCSPYRSPHLPGHSDSPHFPHLSSTRTQDQMTQAARSGTANILEGAKQKSLASYIKLVGVARGSLEELLKDYLAYTRQNEIPVWSKEEVTREIGGIREIRKIWAIIRATPTLPDSPDFPDLPDQPDLAVNLMITLIHQANYLIDKLIVSLEDKHAREGGFSENLLKKRMEYRGR